MALQKINQRIKSSITFILGVIILPLFASGQKSDSVFAKDCPEAQIIRASGRQIFTTAPFGQGNLLEFSGNSANSLHYFQREKNTAWFKFKAVTSGDFIFTIQPQNLEADFDFLLFENTGLGFCEDLLNRKVKPIRTNISRNDTLENSRTGLSLSAKHNYVKSGVGSHVSKSVTVAKGDSFYLVIDNVKGIESTFFILFDYYTNTPISGQVHDEESHAPIKGATITWEEKSGEILAQTTTDDSGRYRMDVPIKKTKMAREYILVANKTGHFFSEQNVKASATDSILPISVVLPSLKKGAKMVLQNINFYGNQSIVVPQAFPSMKRLQRLMRANKTLEITIAGHTNGCPSGKKFSKKLSEDRSETVKRYLVSQNIKADRISTIGLDCQQMIFPNPQSEEEGHINRRVEILVVAY